MTNLFSLFTEDQDDTPSFEVVEETAGNWHYHLRKEGNREAFCGETKVMNTSQTVRSWGSKADHLPMSYCGECSKKVEELAF